MSLTWACCCTAVSQWVVVYRGPQREHVCKDLKAATQYSLRISTETAGGHSQVSVRNIRNSGLGLNDGDLFLNYLLLREGGAYICVCVFVCSGSTQTVWWSALSVCPRVPVTTSPYRAASNTGRSAYSGVSSHTHTKHFPCEGRPDINTHAHKHSVKSFQMCFLCD